GLFKGGFGNLAVGDVVRVSVEGGLVKYYRNGVLVFTSAAPPVYPLLVDTAINSLLGTLSNVVICGGNLGSNATFTPLVTYTATNTRTNTPTLTPTNTPTSTPTGVLPGLSWEAEAGVISLPFVVTSG